MNKLFKIILFIQLSYTTGTSTTINDTIIKLRPKKESESYKAKKLLIDIVNNNYKR